MVSQREIVYLVFYAIAFFVAIHRFRWAPGLFPIVLHTALQVAAFSIRLYWRNNDIVPLSLIRGEFWFLESLLHDFVCCARQFRFTNILIWNSSLSMPMMVFSSHLLILFLNTKTAVQALLAISFLLLCYQMIILKAEHFHLPRTNPSRWLLHRYRIAIHLLSILLLVNLIITIVYSALLGNTKSSSKSEEVKGLWHTYNIVLFIFWSLLFLFMIFTPFWARVTHVPTGLFLTLLVSLCISGFSRF